MAIVLFRGVQEALSNVRRHAAASRVEIALSVTDGGLVLSVTDDGVGMASPHLEECGEDDSFGLIGMRQRVAAQGGRLDVATPAGGGCRLTMSFDL
jgi:signal transduction histidine kinase